MINTWLAIAANVAHKALSIVCETGANCFLYTRNVVLTTKIPLISGTPSATATNIALKPLILQ